VLDVEISHRAEEDEVDRPGADIGHNPSPSNRKSGRALSAARTARCARRALQDIVLGIVSKATEWPAGPDGLGFGWDQCVDIAPLEGTVHLRIGIASISRDLLDVDSLLWLQPRPLAVLSSPLHLFDRS
jgi:hypothetical protein